MLKNLTTQLKCKNAFEGKTMNFQSRYKLVNPNSPISVEFTIKIIPSKKTLGQSGLSGEVHIFFAFKEKIILILHCFQNIKEKREETLSNSWD